ncbi:hypothetical protein PIB30_087312 [Stylosanthes scabra]|uniref:Putative plant transposon protein domain-containing protein n=1 Tax=Stylosanthes scabra TaxID=79078 RepID=A0ABU6RTQ9_9FABA|nr:hypothetical protein [Stylosanthes scabra]
MAATLLRKKKGKAPATSLSEAPLFKTVYHEPHYKRFFIAREVLPEAKIEVDDDSLAPMATQIKTRKWQKLTRPTLNVGYSLVREFYANAWRTDAEKKSPPPYTTQVQGAEISFAPDDIRRVFKLRETPLPNAPPYHDRKANNDLGLEEVLESIIPTINRSEVTVERAVLIHSIIIGEDIRVEEIIADQIYKHVNKTNLRSKLPFPGLISLLCQEKKVSIPGDTLIPCESGTNGELMGRAKEPREPRKPRRQPLPRQEGQPQQQQFQQAQFPPEFMENSNSTMATMQQHYDQKWDAQQQRFDEAKAENLKSFGEINTRMNQMDDQLSYLCYTHQIANESMFFPYQNTMRQFREMEHQQIPINLGNLNTHRAKEEEMRQERIRYEKVLEEAAAQRAKELNKGKVREEENETDNAETKDEGDEW